jgi:hypothetical protein
MIQRILYLTLFSTLAFTAKAQVEFAPIGAEWVYNAAIDADPFDYDPLDGFFVYKSTGDTTINSQTYRKVGYLLFKQEGDKVYLRYQNALHLVFDFGLEVGDTITLAEPICLFPNYNKLNANIWQQTYLVDSITTLIVNGQPLKKFGLSYWFGNSSSFGIAKEYIEKMGNFRWFVGDCPIPQSHLFPWLRCYKDSLTDYKTDRFLSFNISDCYYLPPSAVEQPSLSNIRIAPNPVTDVLTIDMADQTITDLSITDISGKVIYTQPATQSGMVRISTSNWHTGIYLCRAQCGTQWLVWKVVK